MSHKVISRIADIPTTEHWAVIENNSYTIPGDERSRTHPGHGYPESTENYLSYRAFTSKEELESWLKYDARTSWGHKQYQVIYVKPVTVKETVTVEVKS